MPKTKKWRAYVIYAAPDQYGRGGVSHYFAEDGSVTDRKEKAARFVTHGDAQDFAKAKKITLDGAMRYIGQEDFTYREA
jgi:hypothetical protein